MAPPVSVTPAARADQPDRIPGRPRDPVRRLLQHRLYNEWFWAYLFLLPALAIKWANDWMRKNTEVVYRITIRSITGKCTSEIKIAAAKAQPTFCPKPLHD